MRPAPRVIPVCGGCRRSETFPVSTSATWRLLIDGPVAGASNMARDRAIQLAVEAGEAPPTVRLYRWVRPTLTLGRFQSAEDVDLARAAVLGVDVVRRFTGGRAVLHDDELTYAIIASTADGVPRGVAASYRYLCAALAAAYRRFGVDAEVTRHDRSVAPSAACYLATSRADLSLGALKLSGSAQVWHHDTVLQHGSFTVTRDVAREAEVLRLEPEQAQSLCTTVATIFSATGVRPNPDELVTPVIEAFSEVLGIDLERGSLSESERERERELLLEVTVYPLT